MSDNTPSLPPRVELPNIDGHELVYSISDIEHYLALRRNKFNTAESQMILDLYARLHRQGGMRKQTMAEGYVAGQKKGYDAGYHKGWNDCLLQAQAELAQLHRERKDDERA